MVERAEQQHRVDGNVGKVKCPGVRDGRVQRDVGVASRRDRALHVQRDQVAVMDFVPALREPDCVPAGTAADVGYHRRRGRQMPGEDFLRPFELDDAEWPIEPIELGTRLVVSADVRLVGHYAILTRAGMPRSRRRTDRTQTY